MSIYDEYEYIGRLPDRRRLWAGPNGSVAKNRDGTWEWESKELAFIAPEGQTPEGLRGTAPTFEEAVQMAESAVICEDPENRLTV